MSEGEEEGEKECVEERGRRGERETAHSRERKQTSKKQSLFTK